MQQLHCLFYLKGQKAILEEMTKEGRKKFYSVFKLNKIRPSKNAVLKLPVVHNTPKLATAARGIIRTMTIKTRANKR